VDKLTKHSSFSKLVCRKDRAPVTQHSFFQSPKKQGAVEVEEESDLNQNNGLPFPKQYADYFKEDMSEVPLIVLSLGKTSFTQVQEKTEKLWVSRLDLFFNSFSLFYNRKLLSHFQIFQN